MSLRKQHGGKTYEVFPMEIRRAQLGGRTVYDRDTRGRSWLILELRTPKPKFIPLGSDSLITADGKIFCVQNS